MSIDKLISHKHIWNKKKIIRVIYTEWYQKILKDIKSENGKTLELGAGSGNFKEFKPETISADIEKCDWLDMCFDAHDIPFKDNSISNIVMIDVLHHLSNPIRFFKEAYRVLERNGRIIIIEPFPSPISLIVYRIFHPEPFIFNINYFNKKEINEKDSWDSNQAIAYLLFYKYFYHFSKLFDDKLITLKRQKMCCLLYPLSGGFENKQLIPDFLISFFNFLEYLLIPLRWLMAFRCYILLQKK